MHPQVATTLRRMALWASALAATLGGHLATTGDVHLLPVAPVAWMGLLALVALLGARTTRFRAWGPTRTLMVLLAAQAVLHVLMHWAPWAFGFVTHGHAALVTPGAVVAHALVALLLLCPLCAGQRLLARMVAAVRALAPSRRRRTVPVPARRLGLALPAPRGVAARAPRTSRGPPRGRLRPPGVDLALHAR